MEHYQKRVHVPYNKKKRMNNQTTNREETIEALLIKIDVIKNLGYDVKKLTRYVASKRMNNQTTNSRRNHRSSAYKNRCH